MKCVICRHGETNRGTATVVLERDGAVLVVRSVPANVCENCGEEYLDESTSRTLLQQLDESAEGGTQLELRVYAPA